MKSLLSTEEQSIQQLHPHLALSAKQRYGIAASIAWSVLYLSGSPWLGDRWDEDQVRMFLEKSINAGREMLSRHPCTSYLFPTPTIQQQTLMNDFKHLIPNKAVFALGILLIELCINKPFEELRENRLSGAGTSSVTLLDDYQVALSKLDEVYRLAGDSYGYAAERCVKFSFQGRDVTKDFDFSQFRQQFHDAVVAPVQATYLMIPDSYIPV